MSQADADGRAEAPALGLLRFLCYDTALGPCGLAWSSQGIVGSQLPEASRGETVDRMRQRFPSAQRAGERDALPAFVLEAMATVRAMLRGEACQLTAIPLDERGIGSFHRAVFALARQIPMGQTRNYGELAVLLNMPGASRAVGQAMGKNPFAPLVPCHRVLPASAARRGDIGGFSAHGGAVTKARMLRIEAQATGQWAGQQVQLPLD